MGSIDAGRQPLQVPLASVIQDLLSIVIYFAVAGAILGWLAWIREFLLRAERHFTQSGPRWGPILMRTKHSPVARFLVLR